MPFKKGQPKIAGRKKGSKNKKRPEDKERVDWVLEKLEETLMADIEKMPAPERAKMFSALLEYRTPKLARTEHAGNVTLLNVDLTPEEQRKIAENLQRDH